MALNSKLAAIMTTSPVIPVIVINNPADAVPLATALYQGGLRVLEVTLRTPYGLEAISAIRKAIPDACVGAGTVISPNDVLAVSEAGGQFLVSPGVTDALINAASQQRIPLLPGIATPSEAMKLLVHGITHMKFFPAEAAGGIPMLKSIYGPFPQITFCPTGGITPLSAKDYLVLPNVSCVGGSWMVPQNLIDTADWNAIEILAREASALAEFTAV